MRNIWILVMLFAGSLYGAQQLSLPPIKKTKQSQTKLKTKIAADGTPAYLIKVSGKTYWLSKETIQHLEKIEQLKQDWHNASRLGLSLNDYCLFKEQKLLREQTHSKKA